MGDHFRSEEGFGLVEAVIAMLLLAIIAMAMLPSLWDGIRYSVAQSAVATATRHLNTVVDTIRAHDSPTCGDITTALGLTVEDGRGHTITVRVQNGAGLDCPGDASTHMVDLPLEALDNGEVLARVHAQVYVP